MKIAAALCTVLALAAELWGIALLVAESRRAGQILRSWRDANPAGHAEGSFGQQTQLNGIVEELLGGQANRRLAIGLVLGGVVLGALANLLSL